MRDDRRLKNRILNAAIPSRLIARAPYRKIVAIAAAALLAGGQCAAAQAWPTRPLTMVVPFAAGSGSDVFGRVLAARLSELLGKPVIIENLAGAGGMTGSSRVAKAAPDGYLFVLGNVGTHAQNQSLYRKPLYNAATDFAPVALIAEQPILLVARKDLPANNVREFIAYAKANAAKMQFGSVGAGSANHLACALVNAKAGISVTHIPYRTGLMQDLIAGRIDYTCPISVAAVPHIASKAIKPIAILTKGRSDILPALASAHEQGLVDFDAAFWSAMFLPRGTPMPIVQRLHDALVATMDTQTVQARLKGLGATLVAPERRTPEYLQRFVEGEIEKWAVLIKANGASAD
jgi:tripartite-type tricarboxylate transporter receptor subunit TctC